MKYQRIHRQTRVVVTGTWNQVSNLDKRLWSDPVPIDNYDPPSKPIVIETILCKLFNSYFNFDLLQHPVYDLRDLVGYRIHGGIK